MKRLPAQIGITYFSVSVAAYFLPETVVYILGGIALLLAILFLIVKKTRKTIFVPTMAIAAVAAILVQTGYSCFVVTPVTEPYAGSEHTVKAVLTDEAYRSYSMYYYRLQTEEIDGEKFSTKLLLKTPQSIDAEPDDVFLFTSELNEGKNRYYRSKGYYLTADSYDVKIDIQPAENHSLYYYTVVLRDRMRRALDACLPDDCASLCKAVLVGDKYALTPETKADFRYAGASYFVVVSGMHFAVLCAILLKLFKRVNRWLRLCLVFVFIVIYAAVTGFQPSVLRAAVMMSFVVIGSTIRRQTYPLNHLGIAGIVLPFVLTPEGVGDIGLILSFYATMAILLWATPIAQKLCFKDRYGSILHFRRFSLAFWKKDKDQPSALHNGGGAQIFFKKLWNSVALILSVSLAANIAVFPISVFVFREFSLVTLVSSLLLYPEIYLILLLSLVVCVLYWIPLIKVIAVWIAFPLELLCKLVLWIVKTLASLPFSHIRVTGRYFVVWLCITLALGVIVILYRNHYRYLKYAALCSLILLLGGGLLNEIFVSQTLALEVYSCESGMCIGLNDRGHLHLLHMDADSKSLYQVMNRLSSRYNGAQSALCCTDRELRNYQLYREDEFAISDIMLYDNDHSIYEDVISFDHDSEFILDDGITLSVSTDHGQAVPYLIVGDKSILIVPDGCDIKAVPEEKRQADIIVVRRAPRDAQPLRCGEMIICDSGEMAMRTASVLSDTYQKVYVADEEIHLSLR